MIKMLRDKKAALLREADGLFATATAEGRQLTETEAARDDAIGAELASLDTQIARAEQHMERRRGMGAGAEDANSEAAAASGAPSNDRRFASFGDQMMAVARAGVPNGARDPRLQMEPGFSAGPTGMSEGVGADGGFLVQSDFVNELLQSMYAEDPIASRIRTIPLGPNSNGIKMNGVDETSRADGSRWGGIRAFWTGEAGLKNASQPKFRRISLELDKLTGLCYATDELLQDSTALGAWLEEAFTEEFHFKIGDAVVNGTGAGMPLGFLNSGALIVVPKETSQANGTILGANVLNMWARMPARNRRNAVWLVNDEAEPALNQFYTPVKNLAGTENVGGIASPNVSYMPPGSLPGQEFGMLMGKPVIPCEYCAALGTPGDIVLVDLSQYLGIDKGGIQSASSIHVRFIYDESVFRFVYRFNGQPIWQAPVTPYKGTRTKSPFVALAQR